MAEKRKSVLIAEDEPLVREVVGETLRDAGFDVYEASDGAEALDFLSSHVEVDLLVSDVRMPRLNGFELFTAATAIRPGLRVMLMTGYAQDKVPDAVRTANVPILYKPFDFNRLPDWAEQVLSR